jgi:hypothetical protein
LLFAKLRPSDLKLKTGPPLGPEGGKLKFIETSSTRLPDAGITGAMSLILMSSVCGRSRFAERDADLQHLHHLAVFSPSHVLFVVVAHRQTRDLADR